MMMEKTPIASISMPAVARNNARSAPSSSKSSHANRPQMMAMAKNGHAGNAGSRATMIANVTAAMLMRIGAMSHHATPRTSQGRRDSTFDSTAPAMRMAMAG